MKYYVHINKSRKNKWNEYPIEIIFRSVTGKMFRCNTGLVTSSIFDGMVFPKDVLNHRAKTARLACIVSEVDRYIIQNREADFATQKAALKEIVSGKEQTKPQEKVLAAYVREYRETLGNESTKTMYRITADKIEEFDGTATFTTVNKDWLTKFENYFIKHKGMSVNGLAIHIRNIRTVFNWAIDNELTTNYPFRKFKVKQEKTVIRNLTAEQLATLRDYPCEEWQEIYRDFFMLSFYLCGVNVGDLLLCEGLTNGRFVYKRQKTGVLINLPVYKESQRIIDKYKGKKYLLSPLDTISDYHYFTAHWNKALKKIGTQEIIPDKVGKKRKIVYHPLFPDITTYSARYSFASIAAELDIPRETIALCLGHSWADVTAHYIAYDQKKIDNAVRQVIDYINSIKTT